MQEKRLIRCLHQKCTWNKDNTCIRQLIVINANGTCSQSSRDDTDDDDASPKQ